MWVLRSGCALIGVVRGRHRQCTHPTYNFVRQRVKKLGKVFISTPEDTGPAYTQMKLQHRSRAPGPPYNSRTRSATGPGREALSPARSHVRCSVFVKS